MEQPVACRAEDDQIGESGHHRTLWPATEWRRMVHLKAPIPTDAKCASKVRAARLTDSFGCGSSGGTSGGSGNGAVEVAGFVDAVSFSVEVPAPVCLEVAVAAECS